MKVRSCEVSSQIEYLTKEKIDEVLNKECIEWWAYIKHDKDIYTEEDEKENAEQKKGTIKAPHWHINLKFDTPQDTKYIAKWFGIDENYVNKHHGWLNAIKYMTHLNAPDKSQYSSSEVVANFDYDLAVKSNATEKWKLMQAAILVGTKTYQECLAEDVATVNEHYDALRKAEAERNRRLSEQPMPKSKLNIYIYGKGGTGKDTCAKTIAKMLYPQSKETPYFCIGGKGVGFEGYKGHPVIVWSDSRAEDLLKVCDGRGNVFKTFDTYPYDIYQSIKYGKVKLTNEINIVNSVQPFEELAEALVGTYTDSLGNYHQGEETQIAQVKRRFAIQIVLNGADSNSGYDVYVLEKIFNENCNNEETYIEAVHVRTGSFGYNNHLKTSDKNKEYLNKDLAEPIIKVIEDVLEQQKKSESVTDTEINNIVNQRHQSTTYLL